MPTAQSSEPKANAPTLLKDTQTNPNPLIPLYQNMENVGNEAEFLESVIDAAETAGCMFLFEIPGSLFELPDFRAAAVLYDNGDESGGKVFVLYSKEYGTIQILSESEVPGQTLQFVDSYAEVLTCLNQLNSSAQLH